MLKIGSQVFTVAEDARHRFEELHVKKKYSFSWLLLLMTLAVALVLSACGGDGPDDDQEARPEPPTLPRGSRIEPLDTALLTKRSPALETESVHSRMPAHALVPLIELEPLLAPKAQPNDGSDWGALKIGQGREIARTADADDLAAQWQWQRLDDDSQVAAISFASPGAQALRLGLLIEELPPAARLRFYATEDDMTQVDADEVLAIRQLNEEAGMVGDDARVYWGPDTAGSSTTLEIQLPAGAETGHLRLAVPQLSHLWLNPRLDEQTWRKQNIDLVGVGAAGSCNLDVRCQSGASLQSRSVARMIYTKGGSSFFCSGSLLNDTQDSQTAYFYTAAHCISDQAAASSLRTYWFFRPASCNSSTLDAHAQVMAGGARLLFSRPYEDATLLLLRGDVPEDVVFAGSYFGPSVGPDTSIHTLHHPSGDLQKYSMGQVVNFAVCQPDRNYCSPSTSAHANMLEVKWFRGTTEGGSSGAPLYVNLGGTPYVVGNLFAGTASCINPGGSDFFSRYERAFAEGLGDWLTQ